MHLSLAAMALALALVATVGCSAGFSRAVAVQDPRVTGPVTGPGRPADASTVPLVAAGYTEQEYLLRGTATSYVEVGTWTSGGRWSVRAAGHATYETRLLVRRPTDPARFNGTVVVEWLDAPGGRETDPEFLWAHAELVRDGFAWVGVTTGGIVGQPNTIPVLKAIDPARYAPLTYPGTDFVYSIYSQAAKALRHPNGVDPLGGLSPRQLIADGDSGGAHSLVTYSNAIQPMDRLFDGFLIHSRGSNAAPISHGHTTPGTVLTRTDLSVPVLTVESESDILDPGVPALDYFPVNQGDSSHFRLWELPGTSHADASILGLNEAANASPARVPCAFPPNAGQESDVMDTALSQLARWVRAGTPAMQAPRIEVTGSPAIVRDQYGNALGGIRTPALQVPTATLSGYGNRTVTGTLGPGGVVGNPCLLFGTTKPLPAAELTALYPTHAAYVAAVTRAANQDSAAGILQPADAARIIEAAASAPVPPGSTAR